MDSIRFPVNNFFATVLRLVSPEKLCKAARGEFATKKEEIPLCLDVLYAVYMAIITYRRKLLILGSAVNEARHGILHYASIKLCAANVCEWIERFSNNECMDTTYIEINFYPERGRQLHLRREISKGALIINFHYCGFNYCSSVEGAIIPTFTCSIPSCKTVSSCMCMCAGCGRWYCSPEHKRLDWKKNGHKAVCVRFRQNLVVQKKKKC